MFTDRRANSRKHRRERQPWPANKPFKILSLDGGGIRGVYSAELLRLCEQSFCGGAKVANYFDMIAGTSTGAIIALGLGLGIPTPDIVEFYRNDGRAIFPPLQTWAPSRWFHCIRSIKRTKLDHDALERALKRCFGDHLLGESTVRLVVPAFMMPKTEIAVFKTDHHADFRNDHLTPMWRVARATSAAPTYLKGHEHEESGRIFIDGGVWANNPVMVALVDAVTAYDIAFDQVEILSVGTGNAPFELKRDGVFGGLLAWAQVIKAAMFLTTDNATAQAKLLLGPDSCLRIEPAEADSAIDLADYDGAFAALPARAKEHFDLHRAEIAHFFSDQVAPRERHYSQTPK